MSIYQTTEKFDDKHGHGGIYEVNDLYPHEDRIEVLSTDNNKVKRPVIKEMTVKDLQSWLDKKEVEYESNLKKDELEKLVLDTHKKEG